MALLIGIDVGGTNLRLGVVECNHGQAKLLDEMRFEANFSKLCQSHQNQPQLAWQSILSTMADAIQAVCAKHPDVLAVGIGFPGFIDPHTQTISQSPNLPGLSFVDLSADLATIIALPVITENDALAAAFGEAYQLKKDNLIYLGLGTGVGGGLILNGEPFQGQHGVAMEVGHITVVPNGRLCGCGNTGCMEQYASATGISNTYFEATGQQFTAAEIAALAQNQNADAVAAYQLAGAALAQALAHILKVIDVTDVVIGGGVSAGWPLLEGAFQPQLNQDLIPALRGKVSVLISSMGDQAGIIGAAMLAQQKLQ